MPSDTWFWATVIVVTWFVYSRRLKILLPMAGDRAAAGRNSRRPREEDDADE